MTIQQINKMSPDQLKEKITEINQQLKSFGWEEGIGQILFGCKSHGCLYENRRFSKSLIRPTPMNCLAIMAHYSPYLILNLVRKKKFEEFLKVVSQLGMYLERAMVILNMKGDHEEINYVPEGWK